MNVQGSKNKALLIANKIPAPFILYPSHSKSNNGMYLIIEKWINLYEYQMKSSTPNKKLPANFDWKLIFF